MFRAKSLEEKMRDSESRWILNRILDLDVRSFRLDARVGNLSRKWPGSTPDQQRQLRIGRMEVRSELEGLKVELAKIERQLAAFQRSKSLK